MGVTRARGGEVVCIAAGEVVCVARAGAGFGGAVLAGWYGAGACRVVGVTVIW